ncbi:sugar transferase [Devosia sp. 919]|uniref:sugar transferase n=1 Tax=Devosia sp. 919 TaxID=2726065 RepID=UPI00155570DD|nr:sugar transferase [Devosia sp. 919]
MSLVNSDVSRIPSFSELPRGGKLKRSFDIGAAAILLFLALPAMLIIAMMIATWDPGPVLFAHERIGYKGRRFRCLKFRSMVVNSSEVLARHLEASPGARAEWNASQKLCADPRITPLGQFLRITSLDELPQLINVLKGEMSLVGPRPIVQAEVPRYADAISAYWSARPGITGLWQVSGRSDLDYNSRVALDEHYVHTWSMPNDLSILLRTLVVVLVRKGSR